LGNEDPDIFRYSFTTGAFPPHGANRGRYSNPEIDALIREAGESSDQNLRRKDYVRVQEILARDLPSFNLWYLDTVMVHSRRLSGVHVSSSANFDFLKTAKVSDH
jgi:peptide/nickel transport system substrate-binding protein